MNRCWPAIPCAVAAQELRSRDRPDRCTDLVERAAPDQRLDLLAPPRVYRRVGNPQVWPWRSKPRQNLPAKPRCPRDIVFRWCCRFSPSSLSCSPSRAVSRPRPLSHGLFHLSDICRNYRWLRRSPLSHCVLRSLSRLLRFHRRSTHDRSFRGQVRHVPDRDRIWPRLRRLPRSLHGRGVGHWAFMIIQTKAIASRSLRKAGWPMMTRWAAT